MTDLENYFELRAWPQDEMTQRPEGAFAFETGTGHVYRARGSGKNAKKTPCPCAGLQTAAEFESPRVEELRFRSAELTNELWIADKKLFTKPTGVDVEFVSSCPFDWIIADAHGSVVRTHRNQNEHGGWSSISLPSLGLFSDYSIGFRHVAGCKKAEQMQIKQGVVYFLRT